MKLHKLLVATLLAFGVPLAGFAQNTVDLSDSNDQDLDDELVYLSPFEVSSDRVTAYRVTDSAANRVRRDLIDTAASISVVSSEFINDIGANSLIEATQYLSGVSYGALGGPSGIFDRQTIRGFEIYGSTIDNFTLSGMQANLEPQLIERIEILKGPNALLSPSGAPGGTSNIITKSPKFESAHVLRAEIADNHFGDKVSLDSTGRVPGTDRFAYRVVASYQDAHSFVPGQILNKTLNPMLTWAISPKAQLKIKGNFIDWALIGAATTPHDTLGIRHDLPHGATVSKNDILPGYVYGEANGSPAWLERRNKVSMGTVDFTTALGEHLSLRLAALRRYSHTYGNGGGLWTASYGGERRDPYTGIYTPYETWDLLDSTLDYDPVTNPFVSTPTPIGRDPSDSAWLTENYSHTWGHEAHYQADLAGKWDFGHSGGLPLATLHTVVGASRSRKYGNSWSKDIPGDELLTFDFSQPFLRNTPRPSGTQGDATLSSQAADLRKTTTQLYANTQLDLLQGRLLLGGGIAFQRMNNSEITYMRWGNVINDPSDRIASKNTPSYSVLYKVTPWASVYGSHGTNAEGTGYDNGTSKVTLWREGKQDEAGVKLELFNKRLSITAAYFDLKQTNMVTEHPNKWQDNSLPDIRADIKNRGFELDVVGQVTQRLTVIASYTDMKVRDEVGRRRMGIPDEMYNALVKYAFSSGAAKGFGLFAGVNHVGSQAGERIGDRTKLGVVIPVGLYMPARTIFNAGASYDYGPLRFQLNVDNLFDKETVWQPGRRDGVSPFPERNIRLTTTYSF